MASTNKATSREPGKVTVLGTILKPLNSYRIL